MAVMDREHLEAVIRHELTSLTLAADSPAGVTTGHLNAATDHILTCADAYRLWRRVPDGAGYPPADANAADHRNALAMALSRAGKGRAA